MRPSTKTMAATALCLPLAACGGAGSTAGADGEAYPSDTVTITVPYSAGGPTDTAARTVAACLEEELDATFVVQNQPGGAGAVGTSEVANSQPDGYTLGVVSPSTAVVAPLLQGDVGYTYEDLRPAGMLTETPGVIAVHPDSEYDDAEALFAAAEASPSEVTVATPGAATLYALELERLSEQYGVEFQMVPFQGGSEAQAALLGGNVDALWDAASQPLLDAFEQGRMRPLAVGTEERLPFLSDVPTLVELGYEDLVSTTTFFSLAGPDGLDSQVVSTLEEALSTCLQDDSVIDTLGDPFVPDEFVGADAVAERLAQAHEAFSQVVD